VTLHDTGIVVIARNEGERLERCLERLSGRAAVIVYADSASTDGSVAAARRRGVAVVELDPARGLNAARGRNAGVARLLELRPDLAYVMFLDGDCLLVDGFLEIARQRLEQDAQLGAVCGRRRELQPAASVFNRLVDLEWDTPVGDARPSAVTSSCAPRRCARPGVTTSSSTRARIPSSPSVCAGLGWRILRIERDMSLHDVALHRFAAWWRRHKRGGPRARAGLLDPPR
jgi:glycosyltransferase involved in cell wall biosynthesis